MKLIRKITIGLCLVCCMFLFCACTGNNNERSLQEELVGEWYSAEEAESIIFYEDGTVHIEEDSGSDTDGYYEIIHDGNAISLETEEAAIIVDFVLAEDTLRLTYDDETILYERLMDDFGEVVERRQNGIDEEKNGEEENTYESEDLTEEFFQAGTVLLPEKSYNVTEDYSIMVHDSYYDIYVGMDGDDIYKVYLGISFFNNTKKQIDCSFNTGIYYYDGNNVCYQGFGCLSLPVGDSGAEHDCEILYLDSRELYANMREKLKQAYKNAGDDFWAMGCIRVSDAYSDYSYSDYLYDVTESVKTIIEEL